MSYGNDFRQRVIAYVKEGRSKKKPMLYLALAPTHCIYEESN